MGNAQSVPRGADEAGVLLWKLLEKKITHPSTPQRATDLLGYGAAVESRPDEIPAARTQNLVQLVQAALRNYQHAQQTESAQQCQTILSSLIAKVNEGIVEAVKKDDLQRLKLMGDPTLGGDTIQRNANPPFGLVGIAVQHSALRVLPFLLERPENRSLILFFDQSNRSLYSLTPQREVQQFLVREMEKQICCLPPSMPEAEAIRLIRTIRGAGIPMSLECRDQQGFTLLCYAVMRHQAELLLYLTSIDCNMDVVTNAGQTVLQLLHQQGRASPAMIQLVVTIPRNKGLATLIKSRGAAITLQEVQDQIVNGAEVNPSSRNTSTPLHLLVEVQASTELISTFITEQSPEINTLDQNKLRPVEVAVLQCVTPESPGLTTLSHFLDLKIPIFSPALGMSLLQFAKRNQRPLAEAIIQKTLNTQLWKVLQKCTAQPVAPNAPIMKEFDEFMRLGADPNYCHEDEDYPVPTSILSFVSASGPLLLVQALVLNRADPFIKAYKGDGTTPVLAAAAAGRIDVLSFFRFQLAMPLNGQTNDGLSALHLAVRGRHLSTVLWLVQNGVNANLRTLEEKGGQTALQMAQEKPLSDDPWYASAVNRGWDEQNQARLEQILSALDFDLTFGPDVAAEAPVVRKNPPAESDESADVCVMARAPMWVDLPPPPPITEGQVRVGRNLRAPNEQLLVDAKEGDRADAATQIADFHADIRVRDSTGRSPWQIARETSATALAAAGQWSDARAESNRIKGAKCKEVADYLAAIATTKLEETVANHDAANYNSYVQLGASITTEHLPILCVDKSTATPANPTDAIAILANLLTHPPHLQSLYNVAPGKVSLYQIALSKRHPLLPDYIRGRLSVALHEELKRGPLQGETLDMMAAKKLDTVKRMLLAGAAADLEGVYNTAVAIMQGSMGLLTLLLNYGARLPPDALTLPLPAAMPPAQQVEFRRFIERQQYQRKCRLAAARGDLPGVIACHANGANLNARNVWGGTAVSATLEYGSYLPILHYLVSRGGSVLHGLPEQRMTTVVQHAKNCGYPPSVISYLTLTVNQQIQRAVLDQDFPLARALSELDAEWVRYQDANGNTALHLGLQEGLSDQWLSWMLVSGVKLSTPNNAGNYPIHEAVKRGNAAAVALILSKDGETKRRLNASGETPTEMSIRLKFLRITKKLDPSFPINEAEALEFIPPPKYNEEQLIRAARAPIIEVLKEFVDQRYAEHAYKLWLCERLVQEATARNQTEALDLLVPHLDVLRKSRATVFTELGESMLLGLIKSATASLLPDDIRRMVEDPKGQGFASMWGGLLKHNKDKIQWMDAKSEEEEVKMLRDGAAKDNNQADARAQQLAALEKGRLEFLEQQQRANLNLIRFQEEQKRRDEAAKREREKDKKAYDEMRAEMDQLNRSNAADRLMAVKERQAAAENRLVIEKYIKISKKEFEARRKSAERKNWLCNQPPSIRHYYQTVEMFLSSYFFSVASSMSGVLRIETPEENDKWRSVLSVVSCLADNCPGVGTVLSGIIDEVGESFLDGLDKAKVVGEAARLAALGSKTELEAAAADAAYLLTHYYRQQILWLPKEEVKDESDSPSFILATFGSNIITAFLRKGEKKLPLPHLSLGERLWLIVATSNPADDRTFFDRVRDRVDEACQKYLKTQIDEGNKKWKLTTGQHVKLRDLYGAVMVEGRSGVFIPKSKEELAATEHCGIVKAKNFVGRLDIDKLIIEKRDLQPLSEFKGRAFRLPKEAVDEAEEKTIAGLILDVITLKEDEDALLEKTSHDIASPTITRRPGTPDDLSPIHGRKESSMSSGGGGGGWSKEEILEWMKDAHHQWAEETEAQLNVLKTDFDSKTYKIETIMETAVKTINTAKLTLEQTQKRDIATHKQHLDHHMSVQKNDLELHMSTQRSQLDQHVTSQKTQLDRHTANQKKELATHTAAQNLQLSQHIEAEDAKHKLRVAEQEKVYRDALAKASSTLTEQMAKLTADHLTSVSRAQAQAKAALMNLTETHQKQQAATLTAHQTEMKAMEERTMKAEASAAAAQKACDEMTATFRVQQDEFVKQMAAWERRVVVLQDNANMAVERANKNLQQEKMVWLNSMEGQKKSAEDTFKKHKEMAELAKSTASEAKAAAENAKSSAASAQAEAEKLRRANNEAKDATERSARAAQDALAKITRLEARIDARVPPA